jgi:uroporphyrin-III C-methyltransferase
MTVYLVGAGPGDADLLTIRAARLLASADVVVHDRLIGHDVLEVINPNAIRYDVGKLPGRSHSQERINELLVTLGREYDCVVRLKGGDPFVFGRGGEEVQALVDNAIPVHVVPGISSAFGAPLLAGIPVTHRGLSHGVTVVTGSSLKGSSVDFSQLANPDITLVVLMGVERRRDIANALIEGGLVPSTPVAAIEWASTSRERVLRGTLQELGALHVVAPAVLVIGPVAALATSDVHALVADLALQP